VARPEADLRHRRCQVGRSRVRRRSQDQPARCQQGAEGRSRGAPHPDRGNLRPLCRRRHDRRVDRPYLHRGRRRS